jgi:hypothetical protein
VQQRPQLGQLAAATDEGARIDREPERRCRAERCGLLGELGGERRDRIAPRLRPVVVAILREQLAGVERGAP